MVPTNRIAQEVDGRIEDAERELVRLKHLRTLLDEYPDITITYDRRNREYIVTRGVNSSVDRVRIKRSCGCCPDAAVIAEFSRDTGSGVILHADPHQIVIGEGSYSGGVVPDPDWRSRLREYGIPESLDSKVQKYFDDNCHESDD